MQGYTWSSNQRPSQKYQDQPQPQYQERRPPQYHERSPPPYQRQFPPNYHAVRKDQPSGFQTQLIPQMQQTLQRRYSSGQQEAANQWNACSGSAGSSTFQQNSNGYHWLKQTNQIHSQRQFAASQTQQHYPSDNPNAYRYHAQFTQRQDSSPQVYRNTGYNQTPMHWSSQSDHGISVGNSRGWSSHISNNGSSCSMNNQQQFQTPRTAAYNHPQQQQLQQQQQEFSRQYSGQIQRCHKQSSTRAYQKIPNKPAHSRTKANLISCNPMTPPSGAQINISLPSNNLNQSPVDQNRPILGSNACPDVSATQPQNNQNAGHQSQGTNNGACNINQTSQTTQTSEAKLQPHTKTNFNLSSYADSLIYRLLCSNDKGQSDACQNSRPEQLEVCATKRMDNHSKEPFSEPRAQCTVEPPSKRMKYAVIQKDCWNKVTIVAKNQSDFGVQSAQTGTHQTSSDENRHSQHNIQYSTDPADCLEVVFALQKASQQSYKAIAIVPPISQQISNAAPTADTSPKKAESPPLKIDCVWSLVDESNEQKTLNDKLSESSSQVAQQDNKSFENTTECNIADPNACSASPVECQNDVQQSDCDSSDPSFDLSSVPVIEHTLENLMELVNSLEKTEVYPECPKSVFKKILELYWNGKSSNVLEPLKSFRAIQQSAMEYANDYGSVVFKSIEAENLKKLAHCDILKNEMYSSSEEFRSSWLNVDGQPADIEKVLSEPLLDDATVFKATSQTISDNTVVASASLGVTSRTDMSEVSSEVKSVNPHTSSPTDLFKQKAGNDSEEVTVENNGHSFVALREEREKETFKMQEDINQHQHFNTEPSDISPLAERPTEKLADLCNAKEVFRQDPEQTRDNVSDGASQSPGDSVSDGVKNPETSLSTSVDTWQVEDISDHENPGNKEALNNSSGSCLVEDISDNENSGNKEVLYNSSNIWQVEDISEDENPVGQEALNDSSETRQVEDISDISDSVSDGVKNPETSLSTFVDTWQVEDISDHENPGNKESLNNTSDTCLVEDISDNENSGNKEVLYNSSNIWQVEDISDNENQENMDTLSNTSDICVVEDVSADENSSDDSLFMGITVLSKEDAKSFFQMFDKGPECINKTESQSNIERPDLVACFDAQRQPSRKYNKANACSRCGTEIAKSGSTNVTKTDSDADLFCPQCWEQAPLFELEEELEKANLSGSAAKPTYSLPCLKLEVSESNLTSTKECIMYEGQKSDCLVQSKLEENSSLETEVKKSTVASNNECIEYVGPAGQKSAFLVKSEQGHDCSPPSVELKDRKSNVAITETCIAEDGLSGQKRDPELAENCSRPSLKLEIKEPTVASTKECSAGQGQKTDSMMQSSEVEMPEVSSPEECIEDEGKSEMGQNYSSPSLELKESNFVLQKTCIADEGKISQPGQNRSLILEIKEHTAVSAEGCIAGKGPTGPKSDSMVKSVTETVSEMQGSAERELTKIQPSKEKNKKTAKIRVPKPQCRKTLPKKTAFSKHKLKSGSASTASDDSVLFTPDTVVKINWPQKKKLPANKCRSGESQNRSKVKKYKEHRQDNPDRTSTNHRENLQKETEEVSSQLNDTPPQGSENKPELHGILSVNKIKSTEPKKVRFDLYGSKTERQYYAPERRFSAPATLTVSYCTDYTDVLSAKQKVLNQWSSTFIPKTKKTCPPMSPKEGSPQKKKPEKPQDVLKSNMTALKRHLTHRAKLLSSSDRERSHLRKPFFHQKLRKTLSS